MPDVLILWLKALGVSNQGSWFISEINTLNQDQLHFTAHVLDKDKHFVFKDSTDRSRTLSSFLNRDIFNGVARVASLKAEEIKNEPLQQIFFGLSGTGKSFKINEMCAEYENYRTTFHPDTDYASFVGSYKPITKLVPQYDIYHNVVIDKGTNGSRYGRPHCLPLCVPGVPQSLHRRVA